MGHDKVVRSTHGVNCTGSCSWRVFVKDGIITWETQAVDYPSVGPDSPEYEPRTKEENGMQRRIAVTLGLASALVVAFGPAGLAGTADQYTVELSGDQVVPEAGDPDGGGGVFVAQGRKTGTFCFFADTANISPSLTAVELHRGPAGDVGPMVAQLHGQADDPDVSGCVELPRDVVKDIRKHRENY